MMKFQFFMINNLGKCPDETNISNNEKEQNKHVQMFNPNSKVIRAKLVYK